MTALTFLTALALSGVAAYYSIIGLAAIFPGSFWPIVLMGTVLEVAKLVTVSWLYRNWKVSNIAMKSYLTVSTTILMLITSMGIFGYLSKAHLEHSADTAPLVSRIQLIDEKIRITKENLDANRKILQQLDEQVNQTIGRSNDERGVINSVNIRRNQQKERNRLSSENENYQKTITELIETKLPMQNELSKAESDFGPIKYVAELIYGSNEPGIIDKAVRLVIILIMVVFDPLAILLLIAANMSIQKNNLVDKEEITKEEVKPTWDDFFANKPEETEINKKEETNKVQIEKENLITIDGATNETIPPISTRYDYDEPYSFKKKTDGGHF